MTVRDAEATLMFSRTVIAPGPIADTEGYDRLSAGTPEEMQKSVQTRIPLGRYGSISDIANASVFLFSEAANWITGQIMVRVLPYQSTFDVFIIHTRLSTEANYTRMCLRKNILPSSSPFLQHPGHGADVSDQRSQS